MSKSLDDALNLDSSVPIQYDDLKLPSIAHEVEDDFEYVRENLYDAISLSQQAVQDMIIIAQQSQQPSSYEVLNSLIKTLASINKDIADLQLKKQRLEKKESPQSTEVHNHLHVSTADLLKMIEDAKSTKSE